MTHSNLSLPVEMLLEVFKSAAQGGTVDENAKALFRMAGVCSLWRSILLNYAPIWSSPSFANPNVTKLMLDRAKAAPLTTEVDLRNDFRKHWVDRGSLLASTLLGRAVERTRELTITDNDRLNTVILDMLLGAPDYSSLVTLELLSPKQGERPAFLISPRYLAGAVHLRHLTLQDVEFLDGVNDLLPGLCSSLSHLALRKVRGLSLSALLAVLAAARSTLKTLELDAFRLSAEHGIVHTNVLDLGSLKEISFCHIAAPFTTSPITILPYITHPATTRFTAHTRATAAAMHALDSQSALCTHLASLGYNFGSAVLSSAENSGLRLRCWPSRAAPDVYNLDECAPATLDLRVTGTVLTPEDPSCGSMLATMAKSANIASVRCAAVSVASGSLVEALCFDHIFKEAPNLTTLSVYGSSNLQKLANISFNPASTSDDEETNPPLPPSPLAHLTTLNVYELDLGGSPALCKDKRMLIQLLQALPHPPNELCICYCDMRIFDRLEIVPFVAQGRVVWDGCEQGRQNLPESGSAVREVHSRAYSTLDPPSIGHTQHMQQTIQNALAANAALEEAVEGDENAGNANVGTFFEGLTPEAEIAWLNYITHY